MRGTRQNVIQTAILVAKAGCARVGREIGMASVVTALGLLVGLGSGCSMSHAGSGVDRDGDGYESDVDCNDEDPDIYPGAPELAHFDSCCDTPAVDYDCDGVPFVCSCNPIPDYDGDGFTVDVDCSDGDATIYPGAPEDECATDGIDRDCDGVPPGAACNPIPDADGDGYPAWEDCDDSDPNVNPGISEPDDSCQDGIDQNCDGLDNGFICNGMADADDVDWSQA